MEISDSEFINTQFLHGIEQVELAERDRNENLNDVIEGSQEFCEDSFVLTQRSLSDRMRLATQRKNERSKLGKRKSETTTIVELKRRQSNNSEILSLSKLIVHNEMKDVNLTEWEETIEKLISPANPAPRRNVHQPVKRSNLADDALNELDQECDENIADVDNVSFLEAKHDDMEELMRASQYIEDELKPKGGVQSFLQNESVVTSFVRVSSQNVTNNNQSLLLDTTKDLAYISNWGLPISTVNEYKRKGVDKMFDWQKDCLFNSKVLFDGANLVYSAPTSAGKTLVSEVLMIKTIIERKKKAIFILPFISIVREKINYLQDLMTSSGVKVDGFYGGYFPARGFDPLDLIICTIEKANSIINRLLEEGKLDDVGMIVIDEIHLIADTQRGYILELLITKVLFMCQKFGYKIQLIGMSATLPNVDLLCKWLDAEYYTTDFRPIDLHEMIKIEKKIYDRNLKLIRQLPNVSMWSEFFIKTYEADDIYELVMETVSDNHQLIIFCPSKEGCEHLCKNIATGIGNIRQKSPERIENVLNAGRIKILLAQGKSLVTGIDKILEDCMRNASAFHHAGLTTDERDLIEMGFKEGIIKVLVATSTLSAGVNLPSRRVIIRTPRFGAKMMSNIQYQQMIGRAGRKGKDILGESILVCSKETERMGRDLISCPLKPLVSCLNADDYAHLKRALLEIIASNMANTRSELESYINQTLYCQGNEISFDYFTKNTDEDLKAFVENKSQKKVNDLGVNGKRKTAVVDPIKDSMNFLLEYDFVRLHHGDEEIKFVPTRLGVACLSSALPPKDGFMLFAELQKARQNFVLECDLHAIYLVTPFSVTKQLRDLDWVHFSNIYDSLPEVMKRVGSMVGVSETFFIRRITGKMIDEERDYHQLAVHRRFFTALALQELVNERPIAVVAKKYGISRGVLQSLQQSSASFAAILTTFCESLQWNLLVLILKQFRERLFFGIHPELIDLMKIPSVNTTKVARALFNAKIKNLSELANTKKVQIEDILMGVADNGSFFVSGKSIDVPIEELARIMISEAQAFVQCELGIKEVKWNESDARGSLMEQSTRIASGFLDTSRRDSRGSFQANRSRNASNPSFSNNKSYQRMPQCQNVALKPPQSNQIISSTPMKQSEPMKLDEAHSKISVEINESRKRKGANEVAPNETSNISETPKRSKISELSSSSADYRRKLRSSGGKIDLEVSPCVSQKMLTKVDNVKLQKIIPIKIAPKTQKSDKPSQESTNSKHEEEISYENCSLFNNHGISLDDEQIIQHDKSYESGIEKFLKIIDVLDDAKIFNDFFKREILQREKISVSIGVDKIQAKVLTIGGNLLRGKSSKNTEKFMFKEVFFISCISICCDGNKIFHLDLQQGKLIEEAKCEIQKLFSRDDITICIYDAKESLKILQESGICSNFSNLKILDPRLATWIVNPDTIHKWNEVVEKSLPEHAQLLSFVPTHLQTTLSIGNSYKSKTSPKIRTAIEAFLVKEILIKSPINTEEKLQDVLTRLEMPIQKVLTKMEVAGFPVDVKKLHSMIEKGVSLQKKLEEHIYRLNGSPFNLTNTAVVAKILKIDKNSEKKTSTAKNVLAKINSPISDNIMIYRTLARTISNIQPMTKIVRNGRLYGTSFSLTQTGRISMQDPNLQNVTKDFVVNYKDILGKSHEETVSFRSAFQCKPGSLLISADFCQLELRILTHLCKDPTLTAIMKNTKDDIFRKIAAKWNKIDESSVTDEQRHQTKSLCYGVIYGMGTKALADKMDVDCEEAKKLVEEFHSAYPTIRVYTTTIINKTKEKGYIETVTCRRRYLPTINSEDSSQSSKAERQALNSTIQGSASDLVKNSIIKMDKNLKKANLSQNECQLVLHLHDELFYEVKEEKCREAMKILINSMENCVPLRVPLEVKIKLGKNWGQMKDAEKKDFL